MIGGEPAESTSAEWFEVRNPATGEVVETVPKGTVEDVQRAVAAAEKALPEWSALASSRRGEILHKAVHLIQEHESELAKLLTEEQGKPLSESVRELRRFAHTLEHYAGLAKTIRGGHIPRLDEGKYGLILKRPIGICGAIVPWNFPVSLLGNKLGPALLAGNAVIVKPASTSPLTDIRCIELLCEAGITPGALNIVTGPGGTAGAEILRHPDFDFCTPSEVIARYPARGEYDVHTFSSWADLERDLSAWLGNSLQHDAMERIYGLETAVKNSGNEALLDTWANLLTSDHFYYMCTKYWHDGDVHKYFSHYDTPYDGYINYMNVVTDLEYVLETEELVSSKW